jgi:N-acetylglutamate synthase-like GNAT family acetyltransferase
MRIEKNEKKYASKCQALARDLREHFQALDMDALNASLRDDLVYAALDDTKQTVLAFLCLRRTNAKAAEITHFAAGGDKWTAGAAAALLDRAAADAKTKGARLLSLKAVDPGTGYAPFRAAWDFCARQGFVPVASIDPFPGWEPGRACAVMVKIL